MINVVGKAVLAEIPLAFRRYALGASLGRPINSMVTGCGDCVTFVESLGWGSHVERGDWDH